MSISRHYPPTLHARHLDRHERIDWHDHGDNQVVYPSSGVLTVATTAGSWVVPAHRAVWLPAGVPHAHQAHGPTHFRSILFPPGVNPLPAEQPVVMAVTPLLREVIVALTDDTPGLAADEREHLTAVALDQFRRLPGEPVHLPEPADDRLRAIGALLRADPADGRTLAELGTAVGASERTLSRLFRDQTGMTFPLWRNQLRLHHALVALSSGGSATGRSVSTVAAASGYSSASAFIDSFRKTFGTTPGYYQAQLRRLNIG
jgi:AraC-like DNA-binding protein